MSKRRSGFQDRQIRIKRVRTEETLRSGLSNWLSASAPRLESEHLDQPPDIIIRDEGRKDSLSEVGTKIQSDDSDLEVDSDVVVEDSVIRNQNTASSVSQETSVLAQEEVDFGTLDFEIIQNSSYLMKTVVEARPCHPTKNDNLPSHVQTGKIRRCPRNIFMTSDGIVSDY